MSFLIALCCLISLVIAQEAVNFRIAIGGNNSKGMTISFSSITQYPSQPIVKYGLSSTDLSSTAYGETVQYYEQYEHHVTIENLSPSTLYYYVVGVEGTLSSTVRSFTSPPSSKPQKPLKIAVYGDMGVDNSKSTMDLLNGKNQAGEIDLFLHIGDVAYGDGHGPQYGHNTLYEGVYNEFLSSVDQFAKGIPYMVCPGNHDVTCHSLSDLGCQEQLKNFKAINGRFKMPSAESNGAKNMWYSFDFGPIHFVSLSTETDYPGAPTTPSTFFFGGSGGGFGDQISWLKNDLKKANENREERPWIVVYGHRPMYDKIAFDWPLNTKLNIRAAFEDIFLENKVDLYIAGHIHAYERQLPIIKGNVNEEGIVHIVAGAPGNNEGHDKSGLLSPAYNAFYNYDDYGYGEIVMTNESTLIWNYYTASGAQIDTYTMSKDIYSSGSPSIDKQVKMLRH